MNWLGKKVQGELEYYDSVLDLGCGIMQATNGMVCKSILCCDIFTPYLSKIRESVPTITLAMTELGRFVDDSYDVVISLDVIEHLEKQVGFDAITHMKRIARRKVIIYTPNEFDTNDDAVENTWGLGKNEYQRHRSLFTKQQLTDIGFKVSNDNPDAGNFAIWYKSQ